MKQRILIVDDEESICEILQFNLEASGYQTVVVHSAEEALELDLSVFDLILLDVMMGKMSGFRMAKILKENPKTASVPIIFCSAMGSEDSKISGLDIGADDYIPKPFSVREVIARVKSVLRRYSYSQSQIISSSPISAEGESEIYTFEQLVVDVTKYKCTIASEEISLTKKEMELLILFLKNKGRVLSREDIISKLWSDDTMVFDRTIDVNITRLRKKIGEYGKHIVTRQGFGYGFDI